MRTKPFMTGWLRMWSRSSLAGSPEWDGESGAALIETALALPMLALLLFGAAEFGLVDYEAIEVSNAAKAGVQYGAQDTTRATDTSGIRRAAAQDAPNIVLGSTTSWTTTICSDGTTPAVLSPRCSGGATLEMLLTVKTQATFNPVIYVPGVTPSFNLTGQASQTVMH